MAENPPESTPPPPEPPVSARPTQYAVVVAVGLVLLLIAACWVEVRTGARPAELKRAARVRVDLNKAGRNELMQLPGVGPGRADKILAYRQSNGGFGSVEDLRRVDGIGSVTSERLKALVSVDDDEPLRLSRKSAVEAPKKSSTKKPALEGPIDVNRASAAELERLPGIGPTLAQRIVAEREKKPFEKIEDLRRVSGIGVKRLEQVRPFVTVGE